MIQIETYVTEENLNIKDLMIEKIGPVIDGCIYLGEIERGGFKEDCYHCFSTTVFADSKNMSIVGEPEKMKDSYKRLESILNTKLIKLTGHK